MFIPEELELLICGNPSLDFHALEEVTSTEDGYTRDHPVIVNFWSVVHSMSLEDKKKLLFFCTGSDRSPIRGLGRSMLGVRGSGFGVRGFCPSGADLARAFRVSGFGWGLGA
jgi:ubiquitin-protein ligase E3 A